MTSGYERLRQVMAALRATDGCPWDRDQSLQSLQPYLIEEAYEVIDAIDALGAAGHARAGEVIDGAATEASAAAIANHREELGDVLLQVVFQAQIAAENGWFSADDVAHGIADKMERRHPHVFGDEHAANVDAVITRWQALKRAEGKSTLGGVPRALPALLRAQRIGEKAARVAFDWPDVGGALAKVDEELGELREAIACGDEQAIEHELGDLLFAATSVARHTGVDAEGALRRTLDRFARRFATVEAGINGATDAGQVLDAAGLEALWQRAKDAEATP